MNFCTIRYFPQPYGTAVTSEYTRPLIASFPWLTEGEAASVAAALPPPDSTASAAEHMGRLASSLDKAGLMATSTLLVAISHGSKKTAVAVARAAARARFERAGGAQAIQSEMATSHASSLVSAPASPAGGDIGEKQVRQIVLATVEEALARAPGAFGASDTDRVLPLIEGLAGDVRWLKSTIDTERQLRRYREAHGPLPEHQAPQGPPTAAERRTVVQELASSLERERFTSHVAPSIDMADGREE